MVTCTLAGIPSHLTKRMQSVINSAGPLVFSASRYDRITPVTDSMTRGGGLLAKKRPFSLCAFAINDDGTDQLSSPTLSNFFGSATASITPLLTQLHWLKASSRIHHRLHPLHQM